MTRVRKPLVPQTRAPQPRGSNHRQLQQIIAGLGEGVILVDPDQTILWANEAALRMHGAREVAELGHDITAYRRLFSLRYRNNHPLLEGQYPIDRVVAGEAFNDVIVDVTRTDAGPDGPRWVHHVRSLVLTDADGLPDCLVLVLQDASARFEAEERFEKTFNANPAPAVIARLADLRYIKVNVGFLEMTGYARDAVLGRTVYEVDVMEGADARPLGIERLGEGRTIPQMEATLRLPQGGTKCVVVAGQPIEIGEEPCMLFTFMDMEPRKKAEDALRQSEERFAKAFRLAPVPTYVANADTGQILDINDAFAATFGHLAAEVVGRTAVELRLWDAATARALGEDHGASGSFANRDIVVHARDGAATDCLMSLETVVIHGQACVLGVLQDITERRRGEVELVAAIEAVMRDTSWFSQTIIEKLAVLRRPTGSNRPAPAIADLTPREREILGLICEGLPDKQIARQLAVSLHTVRNHVATIYQKIDVHRRAEAVVWARDRGFTAPRPPARGTRTHYEA